MTATGNLTTTLTHTEECAVHDLTMDGAGKAMGQAGQHLSGSSHFEVLPMPRLSQAPDSPNILDAGVKVPDNDGVLPAVKPLTKEGTE